MSDFVREISGLDPGKVYVLKYDRGAMIRPDTRRIISDKITAEFNAVGIKAIVIFDDIEIIGEPRECEISVEHGYENNPTEYYKCNKCDDIFPVDITDIDYMSFVNFCPGCGAKIKRGEQ